jgi:hypothetical protein
MLIQHNITNQMYTIERLLSDNRKSSSEIAENNVNYHKIAEYHLVVNHLELEMCGGEYIVYSSGR